MLVENINCYVCDCAEDICSTYVAELRVNIGKGKGLSLNRPSRWPKGVRVG